MQWLVDLIIEAIGIPPTFIDRGDPALLDYAWLDHNFWPNTTFDLDLSGIIPTNATAVLLRTFIKQAVLGKFARFRTKDNVNWTNAPVLRPQIANLEIDSDIIVAVNSNRTVEVEVSVGVWGELSIIVAGWWL